MKRLKTKEGFTLIEVIVTILLVAVVSTILLYLFTDSFKNIIYSGQKDEKISRNSDILDVIYSLEDTSNISTIASNYNIDNLKYESDCNNLTYDSDNTSKFCFKDINGTDEEGNPIIIGYKVKIKTFYLNGERSVSHTAFVRKKGEDDD